MKRRLKKSVKKKLIIAAILFAVVLLYFPVSNALSNYFNPPDSGTLRVDFYKDLNAVHLKYAKQNGISGFRSNKSFRKEVDNLLDNDKLVHIENTKYYIVKKLTHSHPYLTPKAEKLLEDIGKRFHKKLDEKELGKYRFQVSSLLRTEETQRGLSQSNVNASSNTSHLYGTTFDISYKKLVKTRLFGIKAQVTNGQAIKLLSQAIGELRKEGRCVVVTERFEACFHITVK